MDQQNIRDLQTQQYCDNIPSVQQTEEDNSWHDSTMTNNEVKYCWIVWENKDINLWRQFYI